MNPYKQTPSFISFYASDRALEELSNPSIPLESIYLLIRNQDGVRPDRETALQCLKDRRNAILTN